MNIFNNCLNEYKYQMKYLIFFLYCSFILFIVSCNGIGNIGKQSNAEDDVSTKKIIHYDKNDSLWSQKKMVDDLLFKLAAPTWQEREESQKKLLQLILSNESSVVNYLITRTDLQNDPEITFRAKKVLKDFFTQAGRLVSLLK